ncbi:hypothetical protein SLEP1_g2978 [Rubroshorea leprosula]|uniref:Uncharacterized protein n=1 Tax=Rubroshorea leprosula TaxID=152421 RepID=A0AAV5HUR6_9ROSI|nr:hypothetical protein SLEP1_g2978 [Rubroshorea leprosula]
MLEILGHNIEDVDCFWLKPGLKLIDGLIKMIDDKTVMDMVAHLPSNHYVHVYVEVKSNHDWDRNEENNVDNASDDVNNKNSDNSDNEDPDYEESRFEESDNELEDYEDFFEDEVDLGLDGGATILIGGYPTSNILENEGPNSDNSHELHSPYESDNDGTSKRRYPEFNESVDMEKPKLVVGMLFKDRELLKQAIKQEPELKPCNEPELKPCNEPELKPCNEPELKPLTEGGWAAAAEGERDVNLQQVIEKPAEEVKTIMETIDKVDELNEKVKRKKEVEEKLQILNSKKHNLVQILKQILNVEEELKRRNSMQGMAMRAAVPLQVEVPNDSGSMSRQVTPRVGSEANLVGENGGGDADDFSNHNVQSHHMFRMSSTSPSPSSESPLRRLPYIQYNVLPHPARASMAVTGSPSRFAPAINQGPGNLPTVSVSGASYIASSPSPAASGGTSVFREARQPSPWN